MNWFDILIMVMVAVPAALGLRAGLVRAVAGLAAIVAGTLLATFFWRQAADIVGVFVTDDNVAALLGHMLIMVVVIMAGWAVAILAKSLLTILMLGWVDRVGGAVLGALLGITLVVALIWSLESFSTSPLQDVLESSLLRPIFGALVPILRAISGEIDLS